MTRPTPPVTTNVYSSLLPDGREVAFYTANAEVKRVTSDTAREYNPAWSPDGRKITYETSLPVLESGPRKE